MNNRAMAIVMGTVAIAAGVLINYLGDKLLGVRLELFWGVSTFSPTWVVALFLVPFVAGFAVSMIYGLGGKVLCYFSPLIWRAYSYYETSQYQGLPDGMTILPFYYWILVLIVAIEAAAFGGVFGEILVKRTYGRRPHHLIYKESQPSKPETGNHEQ